MRRYQGFIADSDRWQRFELREGDVVISTPSKCGTTWMQTIVGMLLRDRVELGAPMSTVSPWLDMLIRPEEEVFGLLDRQTERRFIKTHTPLDGLPRRDDVTYLCGARHPLDVAMSDRDHHDNMDRPRTVALRTAAVGDYDWAAGSSEPPPEDIGDFLRWFVDNDNPSTGAGPDGVADFCRQVRASWDARDAPNVHLFHYADLWDDLDGEMRLVAAALGVPVDEARWPDFVAAATLTSMRGRAARIAPDAHLGIWRSPEQFFRVGGRRAWADHLTAEEVAHFEQRMADLAGDAAGWALAGRRGAPAA